MTVVRHNPLARTRIGAVPYLNAIPLVYGMEDRIQFFQPAKLSDEFTAGRIDVGLLPVVEYFKSDDRLIVPRIAIGTAGAVRSVKLFLNKPVKQLRRVAVDRRSRTSVLLLRVILELRHKITPQYVEIDPEKEFNANEFDGVLIIGDQALRFDKIAEAMDLGSEWTEWTGLPFVFACWQVTRGFSDSATIGMLEEAAANGKNKIEHIASLVPGFEPGFIREYLAKALSFEFGEDQEQGVQLFVRFLTQIKAPVRERTLEYFDRRDIGKGLIGIAP